MTSEVDWQRVSDEDLIELVLDCYHESSAPAELARRMREPYQRRRCPSCGTRVDGDGYCTDPGCSSCGKVPPMFDPAPDDAA
jgi:hypothetical protein